MVVDFWRFTLSNLRMNNARGYLDEFLATRAIGLAGLRVKEAYSWGVGEYESEDGCDGFWEGL